MKKTVKKIFQAQLIILFLSNVAVASEQRIQEGSYHFVGDKRAMSICAAALESKSSIAAEAKRLHISRKSLKDVTCNGQSLLDFATANKLIVGSKALASAQ